MLSEDNEIDFIELFNEYAVNIFELFKTEGYINDFEVDNFIDEIEGSGFHVDFLGLPFVTTAVLMFFESESKRLYVKVVDKSGIYDFIFKIEKVES